MTPRLRILSIGLALSLAYAIYDYVDRNSDKGPRTTSTKKTKKRARTAGVSASRYETLKKKWASKGINTEKSASEDFNAQSEFLPISDQVSSLDGWDRNPFVEVYEPQVVPNTRKTDQAIEFEEEINLATLDGLVIETAIRMGEKAFVTINGQTFTEGDLINDALIEKIENEQITFKVGKTRIIKDVGT
tara:strand:- start:944 stop:1510 length:567 start_codon:yes stop_codon:yes gene_type:complete